MQSAAQSKRISQNIDNRTIVIDSILSDSANIQRWENEAFVIKQAEERLKQIELENKRVEEQRLQEIENQRIENQRLAEIENQRFTDLSEFNCLNLCKLNEVISLYKPMS